jgi:Tol biopolymer transport system component
LLVGCDGVFGLAHVNPVPVDAAPPTFVPFGEPMPLDGIVSAGEDDDPSLTADMLEIYFLRDAELWRAQRPNLISPWSAAQPVPELNSASTELRPSVSGDGLTIYFGRGTAGSYDIYVANRATRMAPWDPPALLALDLNLPETSELPGWSSPDGLKLYVESTAGVNHDIFVATRESPSEPFTGAPFEAIEFGETDGAPAATSDGSMLVFASRRSGEMSIWEAIEVQGAWFMQRHVELDGVGVRGTPWLSPDGTAVVFTGTRQGSTDDELYIATR